MNGQTEPTTAKQWRAANLLVRLLAGRWTLPILAELARGGRRYQDLHDVLDGISYKVLTETLRRAERDELIRRHLDPVVSRRPRFTSSPTSAGHSTRRWQRWPSGPTETGRRASG
ncbi:MAG: winged helix-turn-helix transcriptional regulator [Streptosporangiaceae bacterium]